MSTFTPTEQELRESVLTANARAERLAQRIVAARKALLRSSVSRETVLAILNGDGK